jgi:EmrB/QacA subfamily drug resistance transporter
MCSTILLISLDQTVLNVALPTLVNDLHPSSVGLQWIVDSYTLTNAVFLLFGGALGDRIGRRRVYLIGLAIFGSGSLASALTHSVGPLIGFGASLLMPATLAIIASEFSGHERARAIGIWAGVGGIGTAGGPLISGWLLEHFWWGSIFLINVPIVLVALVGTIVAVRESRADTPRRLDPIGVLLSAGGLTALTYAVISAPREGWQSGVVLWVLGTGVALLVAFGVWDGQQQEPLLDLRLFTNRTFSSALGAVTAVFFAMFGVSYLLSQYIQFIQGVGVFGVGLRFIPMAVGTLVSSNLSARLTSRFGLRLVMVLGMALVSAGLAVFESVSVVSGFTPVGLAFGLIGTGMGLVIGPASTAIINTLPEGRVGAGSGLRSTVQLLGGSFGVAVIASLATTRYTSEVNRAFDGSLSAVPASARSGIAEQIGGAISAAKSLPNPPRQAIEAVAREAFVSGLHLSALVGLVIVALATLAACAWIPRDKPVLSEDQKADAAAIS